VHRTQGHRAAAHLKKLFNFYWVLRSMESEVRGNCK